MVPLTQAPITAKTTLVGLIGWPIGHSVSPAMHNAAFAALGMDWRYVPLPVNPALPGAVGDAVRGIRAMGLRGINVTVPHKQAVLPFLDRIAPAAQAMRAVNTIIVEADGSLTGDNTDAPGFIADLRSHGIDPAGQHALVLGAGGSARAVVYGLVQAGVQRLTVANRHIERGHQLLEDLRPYLGAIPCAAVAWPEGLAEVAADASLIVNCTSLGMMPHVDTTPWPRELTLRPGQTVYDLVYNPTDTLLLQQARQQGARAIGGLGMLIWQGALAFERWTGRPAPVEVMRAAAEEQMRTNAPAPTAQQKIQVRRATVADAEEIGRLHAALQSYHAEALPTFFKQPTDEAFPPSSVAALLEEPLNLFLLAEIDGAVAGYLYADIRPAEETPMTHRVERLWIHQLVVAPERRRQGVGTALLDAAKSYAAAQGIHTLALSIWAFNREALRFFEAQGFEVYNYRMWLHLA